MKTISQLLLTLSILGLMSAGAYAQKKKKKGGIKFSNKGVFTLSLNFSHASTTAKIVAEDTETDTEIESSNTLFNWRAGYGLFNNKMMGFELGATFTNLSTSDKDDNGLSGMSFGLDPTLYFRFMKRNGVYPFIHVNAGMGFNTVTSFKPNTTETQEVDSSGLQVTPGVGLVSVFGKSRGGFIRLAFDFLAVNELRDENDNGANTSGFNLNAGFGAFF